MIDLTDTHRSNRRSIITIKPNRLSFSLIKKEKDNKANLVEHLHFLPWHLC